MTHIIADTLACLPKEVTEKYHIPVIPQVINIEGKSYLEGVEIDYDTFMDKLRTMSVPPKTAAPPPELFAEEFQRLSGSGDPILCIHPSAEVSGTVRSAIVAARDFPSLDIRVIDTRVIASPLGKMVELAAQWNEEGIGADEIVRRLEDLTRRCRIYFLVATLEYLQRGGRIGGASALLGSILQIKPILQLKDGRVDPYEKERTHKHALARLKQIVLEQFPRGGEGHLSVLHSGVLDEANQLAAEMARLVGQSEVPVFNMPPAIVTHGGPGILGLGFFLGQETHDKS